MKFLAFALAAAVASTTFSGAVADFAGDSPAPAPGGAPAPAPAPEPGHEMHRPSPRGSGPSPKSTAAPPSTTEAVPGCTKSTACNYNSAATTDDASCTYAVKNEDCDGNCLSGVRDCEGTCGGKAVCCPATCSVDADGNGMSCDDVGEAAGEGDSSTCGSLEATGCDCSGCGCGVFIDEDGYETPDGMDASGLTCDKQFKVGQPCTAAATCTASECKDYCTATDGCNYAAWNTQGGCILYSSCKVTRTVASITTTYHVAATGILDEGQCSCAWWSCINDGGLGYCPE